MTGRMVSRGSQLYTEIWYNYPPLYPLLLAGAFRLLGEGVIVGRGVALACSLVGLIGVAWATKLVSRSAWASLAAVILLLLSPPFLASSRAALADLPAASLSVLAIAMALRYLRQGREGWLVAAGAVQALSIMFKPTASYTVIPILLSTWLRGGGRPEEQRTVAHMIGRTALLCGGAAGALAISLLSVDVRALSQQLVGTYWASKGVYGVDLGQNLRRAWTYLAWAEAETPHYGFLALAAFGTLALIRPRLRPTGWVVLTWLVFGSVALLTHAPLYTQHLTSLLLPLAVAAACGLRWLAELIRDWPSTTGLRRSVAVVGLATVAFYAIGLPGLWAADHTLASPPEDVEDRDARMAAQELRELIPAGEFIVTDSLMLAFHSERSVPPELVNTSSMRIRTGKLTAEQLISQTQAYQPAAIVFWDDRLESLPAYVDWVQAHYHLVRWFGKERRVYFSPSAYAELARQREVGPPEAAAEQQVESIEPIRLGDTLALTGYKLEPDVLHPGEPVDLTLVWRAEARSPADYKVFVHLRDKTGLVWGQTDGLPLDGAYPTSQWEVETRIVDRYRPRLDLEAHPGEYSVVVGMYHPQTKVRLSAATMAGQPLPKGEISLPTSLRVELDHLLTPPPIQHAQTARLGGDIRLLGYDVPHIIVPSGGVLSLTLYWQAERPTDTSYTVFTHLLDDKGEIWGQWDSIPSAEHRPTTEWLAGEVVVDSYEIPLENNAPPGKYQIEVGMYDWRTGQRLPVVDETGRDMELHRVLLSTPIQVELT